MADSHQAPAVAAEDSETLGEEVDALPVLAGDAAPVSAAAGPGAALARVGGPTAQVAAVAATGFLTGAAVVGLVHRRRRRRSLAGRGASRRGTSRGRGRGRGGPMGELVQIVGTRSLLVDVHLLGGRD